MKSPDRDAADELATAIKRLREIACQGDNISYPSGAAARRVRSAIRDFLALAYAPPAVGRNTTAAALRVAAMGQSDVELNALRDPDIFRDVARAHLIDASELATLRRRVDAQGKVVDAAIQWANATMLCGMAEASWEKGELGEDVLSADAELMRARENVTDSETALFGLLCDATGYPVKDAAALSPPTRKE